jgi:quercetin dioxygenase-like cupin family protein
VKPATLALLVLLSVRAGADEDEEMGRRVQAVLHAHQGDVVGCVAESATPVAGELLVRVIVGESGRALKAEVLRDQSASTGRKLGDCLAGKVRGWDLTQLRAEAGDQLVFPIAFKPDAAWSLRGESLSQTRTIGPDGRSYALYVVRGRARVTADLVLGPGDLAWLKSDAAMQVAPEGGPADVVWVSGPGGGHSASVRGGAKSALSIAGGRGTVKLLLDGLGEPVAVDLLTAEAGVKIPPHKHETSEEVIYVIAGRGSTTVGGAARAVRPGDVVDIPKNSEHSLAVDEALTAVQLYAPSGPEQRFKAAGK